VVNAPGGGCRGGGGLGGSGRPGNGGGLAQWGGGGCGGMERKNLKKTSLVW